jgi:hypothetical protein
MTRVSSAFYTVIAFGLIALVVWAIVRGVEHDPGVVGPFATAAAAVAVVVAQRNFEKRREVERSHREQMTPIYEELVSSLKDMENRTEEQNMRFFKDLQTKLLIYGPTPVVKQWLAWQRTGIPDDDTDPSALLTYEQVLFAVRADPGHDNSGLGAGDLLRLYVNDIDEMLVAWNAQQAATITALDPPPPPAG